jgi:hypothetical protein
MEKRSTEVPVGRDKEKAAAMRPSTKDSRSTRIHNTTMGSRANGKRVKIPLLPVFTKLSESCSEQDPFWKDFFSAMSYGRFYKDVMLRGDYLIYKDDKIKLTKKNTENWETIADFFRENCNIHSGLDIQKMKSVGKPEVELTSAEIRKRSKKNRETAIPEYVRSLRETYQLTPLEMNDVLTLLKCHSAKGLFGNEDIVYNENGAIKEILTLVFDKETRRFDIIQHSVGGKSHSSAKEFYMDTIVYLTQSPFTKIVENNKGMKFDKEMLKQLGQMYVAKAKVKGKARPSDPDEDPKLLQEDDDY